MENQTPILRFTRGEAWFPIGVEESLALHGYEWDTESEFAGPNGSWSRPGHPGALHQGINFPKDMKQPDLPPVVYKRTLRSGPLAWDQYWMWYLYNPWGVGGIGKHEGDWEFVQIGYTPKEKLGVLATYSQHHNGGKREYWNIEYDGPRPVVYVALGSHANYFTAGRQGGGIDLCDGRGLEIRDYEVREFGPWASWPGRWGNSTGEGKSPESPGCQTVRWEKPHVYHSQSN